MGLFDKLFRRDSSGGQKCPSPTPEPQKETPVAPMKIDMSKHSENLNKVLIDMSKNAKIDMSKHVARVAMVLDYSGSMNHLYYYGAMQETIDRLLPIALKFDDNGELESWLFSDNYKRLSSVTKDNYEDYVKKVIGRSRLDMSGTYYAPVLEDVVDYYIEQEPSSVPAFVIFITDGENMDQENTDYIIRKLSKYNMFIQFIGIGDEDFQYLKKLDDLGGRENDNTGFLAVKDMNRLTDEQLYTEILKQYKDWLNRK